MKCGYIFPAICLFVCSCVWYRRCCYDTIWCDVVLLLLLSSSSSSYHSSQIEFSHASAPSHSCIVSTMPSFIHIAWLYFLVPFPSAIFPVQSYSLLTVYSRISGKQIKFANRMPFFLLFSFRPTHYLSPNKNEMKSSEQNRKKKYINAEPEQAKVEKNKSQREKKMVLFFSMSFLSLVFQSTAQTQNIVIC